MQPFRKFQVIPQSYQAKKGHGIYGMSLHYNHYEKEKKPKDRKDWFYNCIIRYEVWKQVKCIVYNHHTHSVWLYEHHVPSALIDENNQDYKLKNGEATRRYEWHSLVIFD